MKHTRVEIEMIAKFATDGRMQPLYAYKDGTTIKVLSSYLSHVDSIFLTYECSLNIYNQIRNVQLNYKIDEHKWFMIY